MRQNWTKIVRAVLMITTTAFLSSCSPELSEGFSSGPVEVGFYAGGGIQTRTEMLSNGLSAVWEDGDKLAVWAKDENGSYVLDNQEFQVYGSDSGLGIFTSALAAPMPDGNYTYYCCYPQPLSYSGTNVTFRIPSVQDGTASDGTDIMIADPKVHKALAGIPLEGDDRSHLSLQMNRMMHHFRFYVPSDNAVLGDAKIEKIVMEFPGNVAGDITYDMADPSAGPALADPKTKISLNLANPLAVSPSDAPQYAYMTMAPVTVQTGQVINLTAYTEDKIVGLAPIELPERAFAAGHSTAVLLNVLSLNDFPYAITFTVAANNLGEDVDFISIPAPEGCVWPDGKTVYTYKPRSGKIKAGDSFAIRFADEATYRAFSGKTLNVTYDSEHAITSQSVTLANLTNINETVANLTVPYLLEENFSTLAKYDGDYTGGPYTSTDGASVAGRDLSEYGLSKGWTGARTGCDNAGTAIIVGGRVDCVIAGATRAYGRLESPAMSKIKSGVEAKLSVTFNYSGSRSGNSTYYPVGVVGTVEKSGVLNGYATQFSNDATWSDIFDPVVIPDIPTSGSATAVNKTMTSTISACTSATRISWHVVGMGYKSWKINNGLDWMYIDNIKVKIANN